VNPEKRRNACDGRQTWATLSLNQIDVKSAVDSGAVRLLKGDVAEAQSLLDLFDRFEDRRDEGGQGLGVSASVIEGPKSNGCPDGC
jgi:hypothetical protein